MIEIPPYLLENKDPFFVCSRSVLKAQVEKMQGLGVSVFYSVKTNPEHAILKELRDRGVGFSVSTPDEFLSVVSMGVKPERIYYYERGLNVDRVAWLLKSGCVNFVVEGAKAFETLMRESLDNLTVLVRVESGKPGGKYAGSYLPGVTIEKAKEMLFGCIKKSVRCGILHHSSSQVEDAESWKKKFELLKGFSDADVINIGGGIPISYGGAENNAVLSEIRSGLKKLKAGEIIAEPGRFIVGPACSLVARAELVDGRNVVLNASVYNTHIDTIIADLVLPCRALKAENAKKKLKEYTLLGSSLCSLDVFNPHAKLPELTEGDVVVFDHAGAYNFSSDFGSGSGIETYIID